MGGSSTILARYLVYHAFSMMQKQPQQRAESAKGTDGGAGLSTQPEANQSVEVTLGLHAAQMEERYAVPDPDGPCEFCRLRRATWRVRLGWLAVYNTKEDAVRSAIGLAALLAIGLGVTSEHKARFTTNHSCCSGCYGRLLARRIASLTAENVCLLVLGVGILGAVAAMIYGIVLRSDHSDQDRSIFIIALAVAAVGLAIGICMPGTLRRWGTPKVLRSVGVRPYILEHSRRSRIG